jgi:hypothetical protein
MGRDSVLLFLPRQFWDPLAVQYHQMHTRIFADLAIASGLSTIGDGLHMVCVCVVVV